MTNDNSQTQIASRLGAICDPIVEKIEDALAAIAAMDDSEVWAALYMVEKNAPLNPEEEAFSQAESLILCTLRDEHKKRLARNATWLKVSVEGSSDGRQALCVAHDAGIALWKEFETDAEAHAAAHAIFEFLQAEGRAANDHDPISGQIDGIDINLDANPF